MVRVASAAGIQPGAARLDSCKLDVYERSGVRKRTIASCGSTQVADAQRRQRQTESKLCAV